MSAINRFFLIYVGFLLITGGGFHIYNQSVDPQYTHKFGWVAFGIFAGITGLVHLFLLRAAQKDPKSFIKGFMAATTIKIFLYLGFLVIFILFSRQNAAVFIGEFAAFYFIFTVFEVSLLYGSVNKKK
jgi:uncharacterized membrane protein HdeD (DUF308 family)